MAQALAFPLRICTAATWAHVRIEEWQVEQVL
jgi:hypothetical protein